MTRLTKFFLSAILAALLLLAAALAAMAWWLSGEGPRSQLQTLATARLGVPVTLSKISLSVLPWPAVVVSDLKIATQSPLSAGRMALRPDWGKLMGLGGGPRELEMTSLTLSGLRLPQNGLDQLSQSLSKVEQTIKQPRRVSGKSTAIKTEEVSQTAALAVGVLAIPQNTLLEDVVWESAAGEVLAISGSLSLSATREQMQVALQLAGGSVSGALRLASKDGKADWQLRGELTTSAIDLAQLPGARQRMAGRLQGTTTIEAQAAQLSGIGAALQTNTAFNVSGAVIKGMDLAKAVRMLGLSRGGETALQLLSGNLSTRGSGAAMQLTLSDLQAKSSILLAKGSVSVGAAASPGAPRALSGKVDVDLTAGEGKLGQAVDKTVGQLVGIPLEISGTTAAPLVQPTRGAMIGGAIGSVIAPVIGTGAGAKMGDKVGEKLSGWKDKLFGK